jgi:hypothetical protein
MVDAAVAQSIEHAEIDLVALLQLASRCQAPQLEKWLLFFISSNYGPVSRTASFAKDEEEGGLSGEHRAHVEQHQWPPVAYFEAVRTGN